MKAKAILASLVLALPFASCQLIPGDLAEDVAEVQSMRSALNESWSGIGARVANVESSIDQFSPNAPALAGVDYSGLVDAILEEDNGAGIATVVAVGGGASIEGATDPIAAAYEGASQETITALQELKGQGDTIMAELSKNLPNSLSSLVSNATTTAAKALAIQVAAEKAAPLVMKNPLKTAADKEAYQSDLKILSGEVEQLKQFATQIGNESGDMTGRMTRALAGFQTKLVSLRASR